MMLPQQAVNEFHDLYKTEYGIDLGEAEAIERATRFLRLFKLVYQPVPKEWMEKLGKEKRV